MFHNQWIITKRRQKKHHTLWISSSSFLLKPLAASSVSKKNRVFQLRLFLDQNRRYHLIMRTTGWAATDKIQNSFILLLLSRLGENISLVRSFWLLKCDPFIVELLCSLFPFNNIHISSICLWFLLMTLEEALYLKDKGIKSTRTKPEVHGLNIVHQIHFLKSYQAVKFTNTNT